MPPYIPFTVSVTVLVLLGLKIFSRLFLLGTARLRRPTRVEKMYRVIFLVTTALTGYLSGFAFALATEWLQSDRVPLNTTNRLACLFLYFVAGRVACRRVLLPRLKINARAMLSGAYAPAYLLLHLYWLPLLPFASELSGNAPEEEKEQLRYHWSVWKRF